MKAVKFFLLVLALIMANYTFGANCTINAGIEQTVCTSTATLTGAKDASAGATTWTQISGPTAIITSPNSLITTVTGLTGGTSSNTYRFRISTICGDGYPTYDEVDIIVQNFPTANAGSNFTLCTGTVALAAGALQSDESGLWTIVSGGNGLSFSNAASPTSNLTLNTATNASGTAVLRWTVTKTASRCTASSDITVTKIAVNKSISAGVDKAVTSCYTSTASVAMTASFAGGGTYGVWSVVSGPNTPSFSNINSQTATVSNLIEGNYILRWTVNTPCASGSDDVAISVGAPGGAVSAATASIVGSPTMPFCDAVSTVSLAGSAYNASTETVLWTKVSGPGSIESPTSRYTTVTGLDGVTSSVFRYTITNTYTNCSLSSSNLTISFEADQTLSISTASPLILACGASSTTINISQTGNAAPSWKIESYPTGYTPANWSTNLTSNSTSFNISNLTIPGTYIVRVRKVVGTCRTIYDDIDVIVSRAPSASNAGSDPVLACNATTATLTGNTPTSGTGRWTQLSGPNTAGITSSTNPQTGITGLSAGVYEFRWTISNGTTCPNTQDDVRVRVASTNPTTANAGDDETICATSPFELKGNSPTLNETGTWTVSPSSGVTFSNSNSPNCVVTGLSSNTVYTFTWTIVNNCSSSADDVIITTSEVLGPIASNAGVDQCYSSGTTSITLAGNNPSEGTGMWTKISGGSATITNAGLYNSTVTGLSNGTYTFEWSITRNACTITRDTVTVTISATVTTANAGADQLTVCGTSTTLQGNTPSIGNGIWTQITGPAIADIAEPTNPSSVISGLAEGQYTFRWTISNGACSSSYDDVIIVASNPPSTPNAGNDITVCGGTTATMAANTISSGTGFWNVVSGPNAPTITTNSSPTTTITGLTTTGVYRFTWNSRTLCSTLSDEIVVTVVPAASAGSNQTLCGVTSTTLTGNVNTSGTWTFVSPAQTTETLTTTAANTALVSNLIQGTTYTFKYTLQNAEACALSKEATMTVTVLANPTAANAGPDQEMCITSATTTITMAAVAPTVGTGTWTRTSGTGTITSALSYNTTVTGVSPGISVFTWTTSNGACTFADQMVVSVSRVVQKSAGTNQTICGTTVTMAAEAPASGVGRWWQMSGPNEANIVLKISNTTPITGLIQTEIDNPYVFRWSIKDGDCDSTYTDVSIQVNTAPTSPNAGADQELCNATTATLAGNTITIGNGSWSKVSGPTCTITTPTSPTSTVTGMTQGTYVFRWTASNGSCADLTDDVTIVNNYPPTTANAGSDIRVCMYSAFNLSANTPTVGTGAWSQVSGSAVSFTNASSPTTTLTGVVPGTYVFRWSISNGNCASSTDDISLVVDASVTEPDAGEDISTLLSSATMAANTITTGTGTWSKISGPIGASITNVNSPTTTITDLVMGTYVYRWTATNGECSDYDEVTINKNEAQTYNISPSPTFTTCTINWSNGSMTSRVVFLKEGTGTPTNPVNSTTYSASTNWSAKGTQLGTSGYYCIYSGSGSSVRVTGLYPGRTYTVRAYEYNGSGGSESYLTSLTGVANPSTFVPWPTTTFTNAAGVTSEQDWNTSARWDHDTIPSTSTLHEAVLVYIDGNCVVSGDENSYNLTIKAAHDGITPKLTIAPASSLNITGGALNGQFVNSGGWNGLVVKASATQPNGTLTWTNGNPTGTVEMYSKASWDLSRPVNNKYKWQFMGIPVKSISYSSTFSNCYLREWDESVTDYWDVWARKNDGTSLQKKVGETLYNTKGYELVQQYPKIYTFKGTLEHDEFVRNLSYTPTAYFKGQHIFGNPYTAAIDIRSIEFGENTEHTVYQYNCGTYMDWIDNHGENVGIDGTDLTPAQYAVATKQTAGVLGILRQIPSMQGFLVKATNEAGGSITIPYPTMMKNSIHQRAKQDVTAEPVATRIDVKGTNFTDKMWYFVETSCTNGFDNGWDGAKIFGDTAVTQIYGIEDNNATYQISAKPDIHNSLIGFNPGNDRIFTLKFTHQGINTLYNNLFLIDMVANKTVNVYTSGTEYMFTSKVDDPVQRFKIVTSVDESTDNSTVKFENFTDVFNVNKKIIINNRNQFSLKVKLYDEIGRCITNGLVNANSQSSLIDDLAKGVYIVQIEVNDFKITKKVVVN